MEFWMQLVNMILYYISQVLICFIYSIRISYGIGIVCVALLVEVNGVFLHARKLMQIFQFSFEHKIYVLNKYINLITFVIFRGGPISRVFYEFAYECPAFNLPLRGVFMFLTVAMACINMILFWRLCKSDVLLTSRRNIKDVKENSWETAAYYYWAQTFQMSYNNIYVNVGFFSCKMWE